MAPLPFPIGWRREKLSGWLPCNFGFFVRKICEAEGVSFYGVFAISQCFVMVNRGEVVVICVVNVVC
jgi:hypothetical protein